MQLQIIKTFLLIFITSCSNCFAQQKIKIGFYELPPYISASLKSYGVVGLLLEKALKDKGDVELVPVVSVRIQYAINSEIVVAGVTITDDLCNKTEEYLCSEVIKSAPVILAYKSENAEFAKIASLEVLKNKLNFIGLPKEYILYDKRHELLKFKKIKNVDSGLKLLAAQRLTGFIFNEEAFDYNKGHKLIDQTIEKSKALLQTPIRVVVKNNNKYKWIVQSINDYIKKNSYDSLWFDYYVN